MLVLTGALLIAAAPDGSAQWFGTKKTKTPPQQRVAELIGALKTDKDNAHRADAAEELRHFDAKEFPEIVPVLIDALQTDASASVRVEAATSLGRLRPISQPAGLALEKASSGDSNLRVRLQAKASLVYYQLSGYHAPKKNETQGPALTGNTGEPPLAGSGGASGDQWWKNGGPDKAPPTAIQPSSKSNVYKAMPSGPSSGTQVPVVTVPSNPPPLQTPPPAWTPVQETGPSLLPPK
jgi:hypothetical protein